LTPPAPYLGRLQALYARMDAAYAAAAAAYGFECTGCVESCCRTRFHHHTLIEALLLQEAFAGLSPAEQSEIRDRAAGWRGAREGERPLCPLNREERCRLYAVRPMICRLHGVPHELGPPGRAVHRSPGCGEFDRRCGGMAYRVFDRTPLYTEMVRLEAEFRHALGVDRRFRQTVADILLAARLMP
jgi:Fe-S-cluster containining protein